MSNLGACRSRFRDHLNRVLYFSILCGISIGSQTLHPVHELKEIEEIDTRKSSQGWIVRSC